MTSYYVALHRGKRTAILAGPYETEEEAVAVKEPSHKKACEADPFSWFDLVSLAKGEAELKTAFGRV
jgi:hypothetical protein